MNNTANIEKIRFYYKSMWRIRKFEDMVYKLYGEGIIPGSIHTSHGEEAIAVGVCCNLLPDDIMFTTHRGHGHNLMKGADVKGMVAELLGKKTGVCKGLGGSMHIADTRMGIFGANGVVGSCMPLALGAGLSIKYRKTDQVCVCFFGDGASNAGSFHECLNMAALWKLPVVYVCENNQYGLSTSVKKSTSIENIGDRGASYGIPGIVSDGMDVEEVSRVAEEAIARARRREGPTLIEFKTYRFKGHSRGDVQYGTYRTKEEWDLWQLRDPIRKLEAKGIFETSETQSILDEINAELAEAVQFAKDSPELENEEVMDYVYDK